MTVYEIDEEKISKIKIGMTADELYAIFPQSMQVEPPDVKTDESTPEKYLIVTQHFPGVTVRLEFAENADPMYPLKAYAVQEITRV